MQQNGTKAKLCVKKALPRLILGLGLILFALVMLRTTYLQFYPHVDSARYLNLSLSLASGQGYTDIYKPIPTPHVKFPPLFPSILAAAELLFGKRLVPLRATVAFFGLLSIVALYLLFAQLMPKVAAAILAGLVALQAEFALYAQRILSEIPYTCFSAFALYLVLARTRRRESPMLLDFLIGATMAITILTRSIGWALFLAFLGHSWLDKGIRRRRRLVLVVSLVVMLALGAWHLRNFLAIGAVRSIYLGLMLAKDQYRPELGYEAPWEVLRRVPSNVHYYITLLLNARLGALPEAKGLGYPLLLLMLVGLIARTVRRPRIVELYLVIYVLLLLVWPWTYPRFILPIVPLLFFYSVWGFGVLAQWGFRATAWALKTTHGAEGPGRAQVRPIAATAIAAGLYVASLSLPVWALRCQKSHSAFGCHSKWWHQFKVAHKWIRLNTPPNSVLITGKAVISFLITGRKAFRPQEYMAREMFRKAVMENNPIYLVQGPLDSCPEGSPGIERILSRTKGLWRTVFRCGSTYVVRLYMPQALTAPAQRRLID